MTSSALTVTNREVVTVLKKIKSDNKYFPVPCPTDRDVSIIFIDIISNNKAVLSFETSLSPFAWVEKIVAAHPQGSYTLLTYSGVEGVVRCETIKYVDGEQVPHQEYDDFDEYEDEDF